LSNEQLLELVQKQDITIDGMQQKIDGLKHQVEWFKHQIFGQKSERFVPELDPSQLPLAATSPTPIDAATPPRQTVITHTRRVRTRDPVNDAESLPFFDESRLPIHTIEVLDPEIAELSPDQYEIIDTKTSYRLAQRPGSYEMCARW
jgi:transposase